MDNIKFYQGSKGKYDPSSMEDGIFFSTDTQEILLNDKNYGGAQADEEDLTTVNGQMKFKDKEYDSSEFSGLGRVYLRKNIQTNKNILTQDMINKPNTIYIIQYDYDLNDQTITIPESCILQFEGGSLSNGTIDGTKFEINAKYKIFSNIIFSNQIASFLTANILWFVDNYYQVVPNESNNVYVDTELNYVFNTTNLNKFTIPSGTYFLVQNGVTINKSISLYGEHKSYGNLSTEAQDSYYDNAFITRTAEFIFKINSGGQDNLILDNINFLVGDTISDSVIQITAEETTLWGVEVNVNISPLDLSPSLYLEGITGLSFLANNNSITFVTIDGYIKGLDYAYKFQVNGDNFITGVKILGDTRCAHGNYPSNVVGGKLVIRGEHQALQCHDTTNDDCYFSENSLEILGNTWDINTGANKFTVGRIANISDKGVLNKLSNNPRTEYRIYPDFYFNNYSRDYNTILSPYSENLLNSIGGVNKHVCIHSITGLLNNIDYNTYNIYNLQNIFGTKNYNLGTFNINSIRYYQETYAMLEQASSIPIKFEIILNISNFSGSDSLKEIPVFIKYHRQFTVTLNWGDSIDSMTNQDSLQVNPSDLYYKEQLLQINNIFSKGSYVKITFESTSDNSVYCVFPMIYIPSPSGFQNYFASNKKTLLNTSSVGFRQFDTTLNKPAYWTGTEWVYPAMENEMQEINNVLYNQYTAVTLTTSPTIIEKGVSTNITLNWNCTFNGQTTIPDSMQLKSGGVVLVSDKSTKTYSEQISDTKSYTVEAINHGITKTTSKTVNAYYPMYFGSSSNTSLVSADVLSLIKQAIKANPTGTYSFTVNEGEYAWLCIPSSMNINKVTSGGFDVPFETPITVEVDGKGNYKCYRSSSTFVAGTFNCVIS